VYDEKRNIIQLSDAAIHYYNPGEVERRGVCGRRDRGRKGMIDFFATHNCKEQGHLCQMVTRGFRLARRNGLDKKAVSLQI
jgi:hypothetical protein